MIALRCLQRKLKSLHHNSTFQDSTQAELMHEYLTMDDYFNYQIHDIFIILIIMSNPSKSFSDDFSHSFSPRQAFKRSNHILKVIFIVATTEIGEDSSKSMSKKGGGSKVNDLFSPQSKSN